MDTNLDDSINIENALVEFEDSEDTVVNQADISLDASGHEESIPMEYEHIEEQPILMDTGNEEIIDFMGDQITLQEYDSQDRQEDMEDCNTISEANVITTQSGEMIEIHPDHTLSVPASGFISTDTSYVQNFKPNQIISVQAGSAKLVAAPPAPALPRGKGVVVSKPAPGPLRQVAIAPKPSKIVQGSVQKLSLGPGKQYAIAPKPVQGVGVGVGGMGGAVKSVTLVGNKQAGKGSAVLTYGKPVVVMPASSKYKLPPNVRVISSHPDQAQLIQNVTTSQAQGNKLMKVVMQGSQADLNQPAVITKLVSVSSSGGGAPRLVSVNKPQTLNIGNNKVVIASPSKTGGIKYTAVNKSQLMALKTPVSVAPATAVQSMATKKVLLSTTSGGGKNVIKLTAANKTGPKTIVTAGQKTQLHQINVPGKGIQYIRLVTNPTPAAPPSLAPAAPAPASTPAHLQNKTFVLSDGKGNVIHMTAEKMSQQPPPLVRTNTNKGNVIHMTAEKMSQQPPPLVRTNTNKVSKPPHKLVRLAPLSSKLGQAAMSRGGQSLLAPLTAMSGDALPARVTDELDKPEELMHHPPALLIHPSAEQIHPPAELNHPPAELHYPPAELHHHQPNVQEEAQDSKSALRALIADTVGLEYDSSQDSLDQHNNTNEIQVEFDKSGQDLDESSSSVERGGGAGGGGVGGGSAGGELPLIVIPQHFVKQEAVPSKQNNYDVSQRLQQVQVEVDVGGPYDYQALLSERADQPSPDPDMMSSSLGGVRPRKACNCTKSQCLKLYCDCFANGEFCNRCNCNNCHNNLDNEELRQKAIRGCLDRNPNAFRPKIGKAKISGADHFRRHNKGCNCKRSGCLKNYCECYEAKIACTNICKCVGCRNVEESVERARRRDPVGLLAHQPAPGRLCAPPLPPPPVKQPCSFMTSEVIEAVCQCLIAAAVESGREGGPEGGGGGGGAGEGAEHDPVRDVIEEFARCLQDIISASHHPPEMQA